MKKICILIPTYNRPTCVEYILKTSNKWINSFPVDYYICDTSDSDTTKEIVERYYSSYAGHLLYEKDEEYPDNTTDLKVLKALMKLKDKYEYIHLCGDGLVVNVPLYCDLLTKASFYGCNVIHFNSRLEEKMKKYSKGLNFVCDNGWYVTYYGATTVTNDLLKRIDYDEILDRYRNTGFAYWFCVISCISSDNEKIIAFNEFPLDNNPYKPSNSSNQPGRFMKFWVVSWNKVIDDLPDYYRTIKTKIKKDVGNYLNLYGLRNLIQLRLSDNLSWKQVRNNRDKISQVTDVPFFRIAFISLIPVQVFKILKQLKKHINKQKGGNPK